MLQRKVLAGIVLICLAVIGGCGKQEEAYMEQEDYTTIHWFSDVSFWALSSASTTACPRPIPRWPRA